MGYPEMYAQVQQLDVNKVQGSRPAFNYDEAVPAAGGIQMEETPRTHKAHHKDEAAPRTHRANGGGRKPPRNGDLADPKPHGKKSGKGNGGKKKKKKGTWWKILLITLLVNMLYLLFQLLLLAKFSYYGYVREYWQQELFCCISAHLSGY